MRLKLSRRSHKGCLRRLLEQASELLQNEDKTLEALKKLAEQLETKKEELSKKKRRNRSIHLVVKIGRRN